ncbi:hypothetical protein [Polaromonas sp. YR568]|uniref:hypothetical protein n=1 Tax=Polaromonas sp. YR568 TaxID=1855301 RepID=UPI00398BEFDE
MKLGILKSIAHNIADSLGSGIGLMIGVYTVDVFLEAQGEPGGFVIVDFLAGSTQAIAVSADLRRSLLLYRDALPQLCMKHGVDPQEITRLDVRYGTDRVYGRHFTVTVEGRSGKQSTDLYVGSPGKRFHRRRR